MKNILELVNLLDQNKNATLPVLNPRFQKDDLYAKFYQEIKHTIIEMGALQKASIFS
jgi:hypothetical protein